MAFVPYSARNAGVTYNAVVYTAKQWNISEEVDALETTNFEGAGYKEFIAGPRQVTWSIEFDDPAAATLTDAWVTGLSASVLKLFLNKVANVGAYWQVTTPFIRSVNYRADPKGTMSVTIQGTGSSTYVRATGAPGATT